MFFGLSEHVSLVVSTDNTQSQSSTYKWSIKEFPNKHFSAGSLLRPSPLCSHDSQPNDCSEESSWQSESWTGVHHHQPLFTTAKQIQWTWTACHSEDQFIVMFGGLHIDMAAFKTIDNLLDSSGWTGALVQAKWCYTWYSQFISLRQSCDTRTRRAHQITASRLHRLLQKAHLAHCSSQGEEPHCKIGVQAELNYNCNSSSCCLFCSWNWQCWSSWEL